MFAWPVAQTPMHQFLGVTHTKKFKSFNPEEKQRTGVVSFFDKLPQEITPCKAWKNEAITTNKKIP